MIKETYLSLIYNANSWRDNYCFRNCTWVENWIKIKWTKEKNKNKWTHLTNSLWKCSFIKNLSNRIKWNSAISFLDCVCYFWIRHGQIHSMRNPVCGWHNFLACTSRNVQVYRFKQCNYPQTVQSLLSYSILFTMIRFYFHVVNYPL